MRYSQTALLLLCLIIVGCKKEEPAFTTPRKAPPAVEAPLRLFISQNTENVDERNDTTKVSSIHTHVAAMMMGGLVPGKQYRATWHLYDPNGKDVPVEDPEANFIWDRNPNRYLYKNFPVSEKPATAGKWRWELVFQDGPTLEREFTVSPPNKEELDYLSHHETAREAVFFAFSKHWFGYDNSFFAKGPSNVVQVSEVQYHASLAHLSPADRLNGLEYKGTATFSFSLYRTQSYGTDVWDEWKDAQPEGNIYDAFVNQVGRIFFPGSAKGFQNGYGFKYDIEQRDGQWRVESDTGNVFLNNRQVTTGSFFPLPFTPKEVTDILPNQTPRSIALTNAEAVSKKAVLISDTERQTMDILRKRKIK